MSDPSLFPDGQPPAGGDADALPQDVRAWGTVSFFSDLGHEAVSALLPAFLLGLGAPPISLGVVEGVADGAASLTKLASGRMADRLRRLKPGAIVGYLATGLAMPAIGLAHTWPAVLVLRTVAWLGKGWRAPLRDTLLDRAVPPALRGRAFGTERAMDQLGAVLAPLLAGALLQMAVGVRSIMLLAAIPGCTAALLVAMVVRERARAPFPPSQAAAPTPTPVARGPRPSDAPRRRPLQRLLVALAVFGSGDYAKTMLVLWGLGAAGAGLRMTTVSRAVLLYAGYCLVTAITAWVSGHLSDRLGRKHTLVTAYAIGTCSSLVPALAAPGLGSVALALLLAGVLVGAEEALERAWTADLTPAGQRGWAFGKVHAINGVGDLIASVGVGAIWTRFGAQPAFAASAVLMGLGTLIAATVPSVRPTRAGAA